MINKVRSFFILALLSVSFVYSSYTPLTWKDLHVCRKKDDTSTIGYFVESKPNAARDTDYIERYDERPFFDQPENGKQYTQCWHLFIKGKLIERLSDSKDEDEVLERFNELRKIESGEISFQGLFDDEK